MRDVKLLETCAACGEQLTLMESVNTGTNKIMLVKRCLHCGSYPVTEIAEVKEPTERMDYNEMFRSLRTEYARRLARKAWPEGEFIYLVTGRDIDKEFLRNEASRQPITDNTDVAHFKSHIDKKMADGSVWVGWVPTVDDLWTRDWYIKE
jgi:transcription elongation factor Elf1